MFIFGTNDFGDDRCESNGKQCQCYCETSAKDKGLVTCETSDHNGFRLYKFDTPSKC